MSTPHLDFRDIPEYNLGFVKGQLLALDVAAITNKDELPAMREIAIDMMGHDLTPACHGILQGQIFALTMARDMSVREICEWHGRILESYGGYVTRLHMGKASNDDE